MWGGFWRTSASEYIIDKRGGEGRWKEIFIYRTGSTRRGGKGGNIRERVKGGLQLVSPKGMEKTGNVRTAFYEKGWKEKTVIQESGLHTKESKYRGGLNAGFRRGATICSRALLALGG